LHLLVIVTDAILFTFVCNIYLCELNWYYYVIKISVYFNYLVYSLLSSRAVNVVALLEINVSEELY